MGEDGGGWRRATTAALRDPVTLLLLALQLLRNISFHLYGATSKLFLCESLGYSPAQLGYILSFAGWAFATQTLLVVPRCLRLLRPVPLLCLGFFCTGLGRLGLAMAVTLPPTATILGSYVVLNLCAALTPPLRPWTTREDMCRPPHSSDPSPCRRRGQGMTATLLKSLAGEAAAPHRRGLQRGASQEAPPGPALHGSSY